MKKRLMVCIFAVLLWIGPFAAICRYAVKDMAAKEYELVMLDKTMDLAEGISRSLDYYMIFAGSAALIVILIYSLYEKRNRGKEEEEKEKNASKYMRDLL